jgi:subtilisin-like proprotein convertase family protein
MRSEHRARGRRALAAAGAPLLVMFLLVGVMAVPASALTFSNPAPITIPGTGTSGVASLYPSAITISGTSGTITDVNVNLFGYTHGYPNDVDILLVGPGGQSVVLMADVCGVNPGVSGLNLTFDQGSPTSVPAAGCTSGVYRPTNGGAFSGIGPAPAGPYGSTLSVFNTLSANGTWNLWVYDDLGGDSGTISGGWNLDIAGPVSGPTITSFAPTSGTPGTSVVITGTNLTGATAVTFGGVSATFTVNSATQITATVPTGAVTGPIVVTTPTGTATSGTSFTVTALAPTITSFAPTSGKVGTSVVIAGTNLTGATAVKFGTVSATFTVNSATQITTSVPAGASTGTISVTTPGGTATSATSFVVSHTRSVSLSLPGNKAKGTVSVSDGFGACAASVPVKVQHLVSGKWRTIASLTTGATGNYSTGGAREDGSYRAIAKKVTTSSGDVCLKAKSQTEHN